jgi:hypothetical protein
MAGIELIRSCIPVLDFATAGSPVSGRSESAAGMGWRRLTDRMGPDLYTPLSWGESSPSRQPIAGSVGESV